MLPSIEINISKKVPCNFEGLIRDLLKYVPQEDIIGLQKIIMVDEPYGKWEKGHEKSRGAYWERFKNRPASIELYYNNMFGKLPKWFFLFPILPQGCISKALFHEIGHHVQKHKHGIYKGIKEKDATGYGDKYNREYIKHTKSLKFIWWPLSAIFVKPWYLRQQKENIKKLQANIGQNPKDYTSLTKLAWLYRNCGYFRMPLRLCKRSLKINDKHIDTYWVLISVWFRQEKYDKAKDIIERMVSIWPNNEDVIKWQRKIEDNLKNKESL